MVGITFCNGDECPLKESCFRFLGKSQAPNYALDFAESPYDWDDEKCNHYMYMGNVDVVK